MAPGVGIASGILWRSLMNVLTDIYLLPRQDRTSFRKSHFTVVAIYKQGIMAALPNITLKHTVLRN
jgi:hypothetical protein